MQNRQMNPDTTPTPTWKFCKAFNSALLEDEKEGERLNEILCADKDEAECLVDLLNGKERELAEKTNEANNWHQHYRDEASKAQRWKQAYIEQEKENAGLRELLAMTLRWIPVSTSHQKEQDEIREELARLAPASEEAVTKKPCSVCVPEEQCWECAPSVYEN